jgi:PIN domain nuclease of toxin-antitoxin system
VTGIRLGRDVGKGRIGPDFDEPLPSSPRTSGRQADGIALLTIRLEHVCGAAKLPRHHADPFDRLLVAQAELEGLTILTHDRQVAPYGVPTLGPAD